MTVIRGFISVCCIGSWRAVLWELVESILESRLDVRCESIDLAVLGGPAEQDEVDELIRPFGRFRICYRSDRIDEYEYPALGLLQDACRSWSGDVFYLHTKGVSRSAADQRGRYWRALMLDQVVGNHAQCIEALESSDTVGTNWRGNHYSGNFWWARADHIRRLPDVRRLRIAPRRLTRDPVWNVRLQCELWIAMAPGRFVNVGVKELDLGATSRWSTDAADIVNALLEASGGERYLELGIDGPSPYWSRVNAAVRDAAALGTTPDPAAHGTVAAASAAAPYDVVFVDSWHEAAHCRQTVELGLRLLGPNGAVVVHDTNPPTEWHARPASEFRPGTEWNGDVWRAIVELRRSRPDLDIRTVDTDWGCTVIRPATAEPRPPPPGGPSTWADFEANRDGYLNLVSPRRFRRDLYAVPFRVGRLPLTSRTQLINCLISEFGLERYLEIGIGGGDNLEAVIAPIRHGVDPVGSPTFRMTSDEFFRESLGCGEYDLVFIDGWHEADQCLRDLDNAAARLSPRGFIVVHDTNPPTEWHQRPGSEFEPGSEWNGTVWKAVVRYGARNPGVEMLTVDVDWGCTIILPGVPVSAAGTVPADEPTWPELARDRRRLLRLVDPYWWQIADRLAARVAGSPDATSRSAPAETRGPA